MNRRLLNFSGVTIAWLSANPMTVVQSARTSFSSCVDTDNHEVFSTVEKVKNGAERNIDELRLF